MNSADCTEEGKQAVKWTMAGPGREKLSVTYFAEKDNVREFWQRSRYERKWNGTLKLSGI